MDNHIHLLIREADETVSQTIKRISSSFVYWYNSKYNRYGHLFQDRFKSENVEDIRYFKTVLRYIHQNPLKAGLARNVFDWKWTSFKAYLGKSSFIDIDIDFALNLFSSHRNEAIQLFTDYMQQSNDDQCLDDHVKVRMSDSDVRSYLNDLGFPNGSSLQQMEKEIRNAIILELKGLHGVSIRQLARITGISKSVIDRVR
ncbi:transposase [Virgibacillus sp. 179-BFC.A HS]|uniref:Transposase n=1 Tax=Tigheibacillus jepli TaxID=3035914 RepID=A0ABU5CEX2_9BACI|nr:transposase [Virgibacillus sp. 179-BFC.A HS]MDY0404882.1 transposase [Virgibacillus sp. 179-BFC.A HS]